MVILYQIDLNGKVAVFTGGERILCNGFRAVFVACGAKVAILNLYKDMAEKVVKGIRKHWTERPSRWRRTCSAVSKKASDFVNGVIVPVEGGLAAYTGV